MRTLIVLAFLALSCSKPHCAYESDSSCKIFTNGDRDYITFKIKGQHLCCWYATFSGCARWDQEKIETTMEKWYNGVVEGEGKNCLLPEESCGPSWSYGLVID